MAASRLLRTIVIHESIIESKNLSVDRLKEKCRIIGAKLHIIRIKNSKSTLNLHPFEKINFDNLENIAENDSRYIDIKEFLESELFRLSTEYKDIKLDKLKKRHTICCMALF